MPADIERHDGAELSDHRRRRRRREGEIDVDGDADRLTQGVRSDGHDSADLTTSDADERGR